MRSCLNAVATSYADRLDVFISIKVTDVWPFFGQGMLLNLTFKVDG